MKRLTTIWVCLLLGLQLLPSGWGGHTAHADESHAPPVEDGWVRVSTAEQLMSVAQNQELYLSQNIRLTSDIDLTGYEWIPLGGNGRPAFSGTFDGRGHVVSGIRVVDDALEYAGFFGQSSGTIRNLGVEVEIEGGVHAGGLAGYLSGGSVERSYSTGKVSGKANAIPDSTSAGGLAGIANHATIANSFSGAYVEVAASKNMYAGGLVGSSGNGEIRNSYAMGMVSNQTASGLYYLQAAGLAAFSIHSNIVNTYAAGHVDDSNADGTLFALFNGLIVKIAGSSSVSGSYFDRLTTGQTVGIGASDGPDQSGAVGKSTAEMRDPSTYVGWNFEEVWALHPSINDGYPYLRPVILTTGLADGVKSELYSLRLEAFDGAGGGIDWSASGLPEGLALDASGLLHGTPRETGAYDVAITARDAGGATASATLRLTVAERAPEIADFGIGPGKAFGTTSVTAEPADSEHAFAYMLDDVGAERPLLGEGLPEDAVAYTLGRDIPGASPGQFLTMYEIDASSRIRAWQIVLLFDVHFQDQIAVTGVSVTPSALTLTVGEPGQKLTALVEPAEATNKAVAWSTSDPDVAAADATGEVTPVGAGTATITATTADGAFQASASVTVLPAPPVIVPVTGVSVTPSALTLTVGEPGQKLTALVEPAEATNKAVAWSTSDPDVAAADATGEVTPVGAGTATITATTADGTFQANASVTVLPAPPVIVPVTGVSVTPSALTLTVGEPGQKLTALVEPAEATNKAVAWSTSDPDVAAADATGEVTPVGAGTATITATTADGAFQASASVTVLPAPPTVGTIKGEVYGAGDVPLMGATVSVDEIGVKTDVRGAFTLTEVEPGGRTISISAAGYKPREITVDVAAGETADVGRIEMEAEATAYPGIPVPLPDETPKMAVKLNGRDVWLSVLNEKMPDGRSVTRIVVDSALINDLYSDNGNAVIEIDNANPVVKVDLPAAGLIDIQGRRPGATIGIRVNGASYTLPLRVWNGVREDAVITVAIGKETDFANEERNDALAEQGFSMLAAPVDFTVYIDGLEMTSFGGVYTERTITFDSAADPGKSTVVRLDADHRPQFVPSVFAAENGETLATFYVPHNSSYTVIRSEQTFADIQGHWAQNDIELLANKLLVNGIGQNLFAPHEKVTRASFAAMLVRSLGLTETAGATAFSDVSEDDWHAGALKTAYEVGLVYGDENGAYGPDAPVTREQMASMTARALEFAGKAPKNAAALERYVDVDDMAEWSKEAIAGLLAAGIAEGVDDRAFAPKEPATRAECAAVLRRMLRYLQFIDG
ncbi:Ig-like domain-containing protein [Cohnella massiliensis]|uniref:Ig-like domain-containing protein n=1 Tax=Cohnella massiliensis TaxID=1816691 RepID=UPI0009BC5554|nr:Ig-like domain-containing protein [Cohnella massiliensis]